MKANSALANVLTAAWGTALVYTHQMTEFYSQNALQLKQLTATALQSACTTGPIIQSALQFSQDMTGYHLLGYMGCLVTGPAIAFVKLGLLDRDVHGP